MVWLSVQACAATNRLFLSIHAKVDAASRHLRSDKHAPCLQRRRAQSIAVVSTDAIDAMMLGQLCSGCISPSAMDMRSWNRGELRGVGA